MKKKLLACLMVIAMIFGALALSSCSIGEVVDKIDSVKNGLESIGENLPWKDSDCKESLGNSEKEPSESSGTTHSHYFERVPSERCLKSSASCTKKAEYYYSCSCGELDSKTFEYGDYEHKEVIDAAVEPTCTETGLTEGKHCSECNKILTAQTELPALGHNIVNHDGKPATCTEKGYEPYETCTRCDYTTYREIPFAEHDLDNGFCKNCGKEITPHTHIEVIDKGTPATCLNQGLTDGKHCSICNKVLESQTVIPALGHDLTSHSGKAATCIEKGWNAYNTCSRCSYTTYREIPALGHDIVSHIGKAATCTDAGYKNYETCSRCTYTTYEELPALGHNLTYHNGKAATCLETGYDAYEECSRCDYTTYRKINALGHDYVSHSGKEATCTEAGYNDYETCSRCSYTTYEEIPALGHNFISGTCTRCDMPDGSGDIGDDDIYTKVGDYIYFGSYPQTKVENTSLISSLNNLAGTLPTSSNSHNWTSYSYYIESSVQNYMWYIDKIYNNVKYRGVYFTSYRPNSCAKSSNTDNSLQDNNGYNLKTVYWFKYNPIKWRVLTEEDGKAFLMCDMAIDALQYYYHSNGGTRIVDGKTVYENNYAESEIRKWLNVTFYNIAFNSLQKSLIQTTVVDNSARSTNLYSVVNKDNSFACENTNDKVFLLSKYEITNPAYGFITMAGGAVDKARLLKSSDYAKSQGCYQSSISYFLGNCEWWLRSPYCDYSERAVYVYYDSDFNGSDIVDSTSRGVVPALWLDFGDTSYARIDNYIYFGSYPQTKVTDTSLLSSLNALVGSLPTSSNSYNWTSYNYYIEGSVQNYMWYIDEIYYNVKYRGVYFTSYRPSLCYGSSNKDNSVQGKYGYSLNTVYWFKYEPIKWRILTEETDKAFLMCDMAIDALQYYHNDSVIYANNYAESDIRKWLIDTFYNTAFNNLQKSLIQTTEVDNSAKSTNPYNNAMQWNNGNNSYTCENTKDKVFILSEHEITNPAYGFNDFGTSDTTRRLKSSDYAKSQGCYLSSISSFLGNCWWWLRSPYCNDSSGARRVRDSGISDYNDRVSNTSGGVVPALWINL